MNKSPELDKAARRAAYKAAGADRLAICRDCPHYRANSPLPATCGACGCVVRVKVLLPGEKCPRGRW